MRCKKTLASAAVFFLMLMLLFSAAGSARAAALAWNTFLGGGGIEVGYAIAVDDSDNTYVTGYSEATWGSPLQAHAAGYDAFVAKLDASGALVWHTFLGGSGSDEGRGIAIDGSGYIYVTGYSEATWGSPLQAHASGDDAFVAKLDADGDLVWSTFLGGTGGNAGLGIAVDPSGNVYASGSSAATWGSPVRAYTQSEDGFVAKFSNNGALVWNTFLGGADSDSTRKIALGASGSIYVTGDSYASWGAPVRPYAQYQDSFVAKILDNGTLVWNTFLGSSSDLDMTLGIAVDGSGSSYVIGTSIATWGSPVQPLTGTEDAFVAKISDNGTLAWNTFAGGSGIKTGGGIAVDKSGNAYVAGFSTATWGSPQRPFTGDTAAWVAQLDPAGACVWNTFLGGSTYDDALDIALSSSGELYVTGISSAAWGMPVRAYSENADIFVANILPLYPEQADNVTAVPLAAGVELSWHRGSGENCAVFMKQADNGTAAPEDGMTYTASAAFGSGTQIGATGWFCVYNGTGPSVTVTGLAAATSYRIMVCEYNGSAGLELYNSYAAIGNPTTFIAAAPLCQLKAIPTKIHKLLSLVEPLKVFVLIGSEETVFDKADKPVWDSAAIKPLLKLSIGKRVVLSFVFVNPFALTPGEVGVTIGDCAGSIEVKPL